MMTAITPAGVGPQRWARPAGAPAAPPPPTSTRPPGRPPGDTSSIDSSPPPPALSPIAARGAGGAGRGGRGRGARPRGRGGRPAAWAGWRRRRAHAARGAARRGARGRPLAAAAAAEEQGHAQRPEAAGGSGRRAPPTPKRDPPGFGDGSRGRGRVGKGARMYRNVLDGAALVDTRPGARRLCRRRCARPSGGATAPAAALPPPSGCPNPRRSGRPARPGPRRVRRRPIVFSARYSKPGTRRQAGQAGRAACGLSSAKSPRQAGREGGLQAAVLHRREPGARRSRHISARLAACMSAGRPMKKAGMMQKKPDTNMPTSSTKVRMDSACSRSFLGGGESGW
jgi:hypothetical protein